MADYLDPNESFRTPAVNTIRFFADVLGQSMLRSMAGEFYDPELGVNEPVYVNHLAYMAGDEMMKGLAAGADPEYQKENMLVFIAGDDVSVKPKAGDLIAPAWLTTEHKIIQVDGDIYEALWTCHVQRKPE